MGLITAAKLLLKSKSMGVIKKIAPNVPETNIEKALRTLKVEGQKFKASMAKTSSDVFHKTQELKKKVDKIKINKPK